MINTLLLSTFVLFVGICSAELPPILLVPGLISSPIYATWDHSKVKQTSCKLFEPSNKSTQLWLAPKQFALPEKSDCAFFSLKPLYDKDKDEYYSPEGVSLDTNYDFGGTAGVDWVDHKLEGEHFISFGLMIKYLEQEFGYTSGKDLVGGPYDWRMGPDGLGSYYSKLKELVENTYKNNGNKRVQIMAHSQGGPTTVAFLNRQSKLWKDTYIQGLITLGAPWGGAGGPMRALVSGYNFGVSFVPDKFFQSLEQSSPVVLFLSPQTNTFGSEVIFKTPSRNFTSSVKDQRELVTILGLQLLMDAFDRIQESGLMSLTYPEVPMHVLYGRGSDTQISYEFSGDIHRGNSQEPSKVNYEDGDGTVPVRSSISVPKAWNAQLNNSIEMKSFDNVSHSGLCFDQVVLNYIGFLLRTSSRSEIY